MYIFSQSNLHVYTLPIDVGSIMLFLCFEIHHIRVILPASSATQRCIQNPVKHLIFNTAQKMKFSIKDFFSKCDQIRRFLRIWSHLLEKSLIESFIFYVVKCQHNASIHNVFKLKSKIFAMIVKIVIMLKTNDL